mgnify:CR=1 FL=1
MASGVIYIVPKSFHDGSAVVRFLPSPYQTEQEAYDAASEALGKEDTP